MDTAELEIVAMNLYAKLFAKYDGISEEQARQDYESSIPQERRDLIKSAILWLRRQKEGSLENLLPNFYARTWAKPGDPDWKDLLEGAEILDRKEWIPLMRQIRKIQD